MKWYCKIHRLSNVISQRITRWSCIFMSIAFASAVRKHWDECIINSFKDLIIYDTLFKIIHKKKLSVFQFCEASSGSNNNVKFMKNWMTIWKASRFAMCSFKSKDFISSAVFTEVSSKHWDKCIFRSVVQSSYQLNLIHAQVIINISQFCLTHHITL